MLYFLYQSFYYKNVLPLQALWDTFLVKHHMESVLFYSMYLLYQVAVYENHILHFLCIAQGLIFENWKVEDFEIEELIREHYNEKTTRGLPSFVSCNGMDFGYNDPTVMIGAYADRKNYKIYIYYEFYEVMMENRKI